ncbi:SOS response-associated peptidase [Comamonas aquatica]|uniref:SOS response-associated peptidase n=1 Tax=Comamonas aquatica TaxID=225991 RepID=UPI0005AA61B0|nr:SOS response-associated peptidase family protein [Comamonas aquatica]
MTTQYENLATLALWTDFFKVSPAELPAERQMRARRMSGFIRGQLLPVAESVEPADPAAAAPEGTSVAEPAKKAAPQVAREWVSAQWGLVPSWVKSEKDAKLRAPKLLVALNETVSTTQAFRDAWLAGQRCIIPMQAFYVDDVRTGKAIPTRIARVDGQPMGVAGVWSQWTDPDTGAELLSYAVLTLNANSHALMRRYGPQGAERRMPAILGEGTYDAWLTTRQDKAREFMRAYPANWLLANPVEHKKDKKPKGLFD